MQYGQGAKRTASVLLTFVARSACAFLHKQTLVDPVLRVVENYSFFRSPDSINNMYSISHIWSNYYPVYPAKYLVWKSACLRSRRQTDNFGLGKKWFDWLATRGSVTTHPSLWFPLLKCGEAVVYPSCLQMRGAAHPGLHAFTPKHNLHWPFCVTPKLNVFCLWDESRVLRDKWTAQHWQIVLPVTFSCNVRRTSLDPYCSSQV